MSGKVVAILIAVVAVIGVVAVMSSNKDDEATVASPEPTVTPTAKATSVTGTNPLISITNDGPQPDEVRIKVGQTIVFRNDSDQPIQIASDPHPQHTNYGGFDSRSPFDKGETYEFTFTRAGTWGFHDHLAPSIRGTIIVE